jgi:hypothetical protein
MVSGPCADPAAVEAFTISILRINNDRLRTTTGPGAGFVYDISTGIPARQKRMITVYGKKQTVYN